MKLQVQDIINDIKHGIYYKFTIKPKNEDEQTYTPPKHNNKWGIIAYCYLSLITTEKLVNRLEQRKNAEVIKHEKPTYNWIHT